MHWVERRLDLIRCMTPANLERLLSESLQGRTIASVELMPEGATNLNLLARLRESSEKIVVRIYQHGPDAQRRELALLRALDGIIPVPKIVGASTSLETSVSYICYQYIEGVTFQQLKASASRNDIADGAAAIGRALASVGAIPEEIVRAVNGQILEARPKVALFSVSSSLLEKRLGGPDIDRLQRMIDDWQPALDRLDMEASIVHGDFNNRNALLIRDGGTWTASGLIDWEQACIGSPLWDASRFLCYENALQPWREPHFSAAYIAGGGVLPANWSVLSRVLNSISAAESLARAGLQERFVPELRKIAMAASALRRTP